MTVLRHVFSMAMISLTVLVVQNSLLVVTTRFSRKNVEAAANYHTSTLVLNQEILKMLICLVLYGLDDVWKHHRHLVHTSAKAAITVVTTPAPTGTTTTLTATGNGTLRSTDCEVDVPLISNDSRHDAERSCSPAESVETQPFLEEEHLEHSAFRSGGPTAPSGARDQPCHASGLCTVSKASTTVVVVPGIATQLRWPSRSASAGAPSGPLECPVSHGSSSSGGACGDVLNASFRRHRASSVLKKVRSWCALYSSMLSTSVYRRDTLRLFVPAFLFNVQNFLLFVGLSNLDAVSFQVWSQTKVLSTALFSVWLLGRKMSPMQWLSLAALTAGVLGAQLGASAGSPGVRLAPAPHGVAKGGGEGSGALPLPDVNGAEELRVGLDHEPQAKALVGIIACLLSGLSSSYAAVYFEKVVKTTSPTLSVRNIQLSIFGIPLAFVSMLLLDVLPSWYASASCEQSVHWNIFVAPAVGPLPAGAAATGNCQVRPFYFWQRYDHLLTWGLVVIHALGGLLVAVVVKYADNILKGFATGVAVIVSGIMSSVIWGYKPSVAFVLGAVLVIGSSIAFHKFEVKRQERSKEESG